MSALALFKQAGIEEYLKPGLMGAGLGAAGMGLASMFGGDDNETPAEKRSRMLKSVLQGGLLGGIGGAGFGAAKKHLFNSEPPDYLQQLNQSSIGKGNGPIDTKPFGVNHPLAQQLLINPTHADASTAGWLGAGLGTGAVWNQGRKAKNLFNTAMEKITGSSLKDGKVMGTGGGAYDGTTGDLGGGPARPGKGSAPGSPATPPVDPKAALNAKAFGLGTHGTDSSAGVRQRLIEKALATGGGKVDQRTIQQMLESQGLGGNNVEQLSRKMFNQSQAELGQYKAHPMFEKEMAVPQGQRGFLEKIKASIGEKLQSKGMGGRIGNAIQGTREAVRNSVGQTMGMNALNTAARYGKGALGGAAAGIGAQQLGRLGVDAYMGMKYSPEQLAAWSSMGR